MWLIRAIFLRVEFLRWSVACNIQNTVPTASIYQTILWFDLCGLVVLVRILWF